MTGPGIVIGMAMALASATPKPAGEGAELIGTPAPEWDAEDWIGSPPLKLSALRGKVVLVRWFMSTDCPYCAASAPALNQLHTDYARRGLVVVGMYHHKRPEPLTTDAVRGWARDFGFRFPVAVDRDWRTLNRWWLGSPQARLHQRQLPDRSARHHPAHPSGRPPGPGRARFRGDACQGRGAAGRIGGGGRSSG